MKVISCYNVDHTKIYENGTGNQCTLSNININAWQIKSKKCGGEEEGNDYKFSMLRIEHGE